ncbi:MAG: hypothetical protein A3D96_00460 [Chlamydiae bacterium RIFCSPHIGHO2_12_FULL_44_59]|nr:MAG: hypothetical protein A2796_07605 [Chlamydiae bacterium RIFCSPHIGHO2_01_FULL_44_39]OGN58261.1 MAG: hypothetical protein A3C42_06200 [Chlamydiae bacterium RIFCSPHIGHO2_02_FULL_45_9]OGN60853.1 MAG: hypothetical protein A3D96_00460 [Chlamydiae bacterium RIFCSPHIGHO2_12_FULL_44_59]OGN66729.1 MAG: hypothetical protein A2978_03095 [Chlamydiae bacterium RIFCSPLOWO2_01_FULL_44_52]OGN67379.1 MAG: hypothetical protein A3I67_06290 [Chlamydiae bacterium RIFCSPLOWO2_02_FULL_45_22]OGN70654.1 MAG: hyp
MEIWPITPQWIHTYLAEPYLQGVALIDLAWQGQDQSLIPRPFSLKERIVLWLQGMALLIPFINLILWVAWQTFGQPTQLVTPYAPEGAPNPPSSIQVSARNIPKICREGLLEEGVMLNDSLAFSEKNGDYLYKTQWSIEYLADKTAICQSFVGDPSCKTTMLLDGQDAMQSFQSIRGSQVLTIQRIEPQHLEVNYQDPNAQSYKKIIALPQDFPWIQHPLTALRPFILSDVQKTQVYTVLPINPIGKYLPSWVLTVCPNYFEPPTLEKIIIQKDGIEEVPGFGPLYKIKSFSARGYPLNTWVAKAWFDPSTGYMVKFDNPTGVTGIVDRNIL